MAYYPDLSEYEYFARDCAPGARNIGWLERGYEFERAAPTKEMLDLLWSFCGIRVMQSRGWHECDICDEPSQVTHGLRNGVRLSFGTAEIRAFAVDGTPYAAPDLIYHYVRAHNYRPPDEFLIALREGPRPPSEEYFDLLRENGLEWRQAPPADPDVRGFKFEKVVNGEVRQIDIQFKVHLDLD